MITSTSASTKIWSTIAVAVAVFEVITSHVALSKAEHEAAGINRQKFKPIPTPHRTACVQGLLRIQKAIQKSVNRSMVAQAFQNCGIYPFNLNTICNNCFVKVEHETRVKIQAALPSLAKTLLKQGELFGKDLLQFVVRDDEEYMISLFSNDALLFRVDAVLS